MLASEVQSLVRKDGERFLEHPPCAKLFNNITLMQIFLVLSMHFYRHFCLFPFFSIEGILWTSPCVIKYLLSTILMTAYESMIWLYSNEFAMSPYWTLGFFQ